MSKTIRIENLDCANCAAKLEKALKKIKELKDVEVNFMVQKIWFDADDIEEAIVKIKEVTNKVLPKVNFL